MGNFAQKFSPRSLEMAKIEVNSAVVSFDKRVASSTDKLSVKIESFAAKGVAELPAIIIARVDNLAHGILYLINSLRADTFGSFLAEVRRELANNAALYSHIVAGNVSLIYSRTKDGEPVNVSSWDLRHALDMVPGLSVVSGTIAETVVESEEIDF